MLDDDAGPEGRRLVGYVRALFRGARQGKITDPLQSPGIAVLDAAATARLVHRGTTLGDYPPLRDVLAGLASM